VESHLSKGAKGGAPVMFQDVVHSIGTREADCDEQSSFRGQTEWTSIRMPDSRCAVERLWLKSFAGSRPEPCCCRLHVTPKTAAKWVRRYLQEGAAGLRDRSSRPHHSPRATSSSRVVWVLELRRQHRPLITLPARPDSAPLP